MSGTVSVCWMYPSRPNPDRIPTYAPTYYGRQVDRRGRLTLSLSPSPALPRSRWVDEDAALAAKEEIEERLQRLLELSVGPLLDKYRGEGGADYEDDIYAQSETHDEL